MTQCHTPSLPLVGRLLLVGFLVVGSLASAQSIGHSDKTTNSDQAEAPGRLRVAAVTNAAEVLSTLTFDLTDNTITTSRTVVIRSDGDDIPVTDVAFKAVLEGAGAMVTTTGLPDDPLTFTPTTTQIVTLTVTITDPARYGSWRGAVLATSGDVTEPIATLEVDRLRPSEVSIVGAANGVLSMSRRDPSPTVTLVAAAGAGGAKNLRVSFGDLIDESGNGRALIPKNAPDGLTLEPFAQHPIEIPLDLPSAGAHNAVITLTHGEDRVETISLNVIRTQRQPAIDAPATINVRLMQTPFNASAMSFTIPLADRNGTGVALAAPTLVDFGLVEETDRFFGSKQTIRVRVTPAGDGSTDGEGESVSGVTVPPGAGVALTVTAAGVDSTGVHQGTLRLAEVGGLPLDIPVAITVQRHWVWLVALVLVGSVTGYLLRNGRRNYLATLGREETMLAIQQELDRLSPRLPQGPGTTVADTRQTLDSQARELKVQAKPHHFIIPAPTDDRPASLAARVRLLVPWANLVSLLHKLDSELGTKLDKTKNEADRIKDLIVNNTAIVAVVAAEHTTIEKLRTMILGLRQDYYRELVKTLENAITTYLEQLPSIERPYVGRQLDIALLLDDVSAGRYAAAAKEHERLRMELLGLLDGDLRRRMEDPPSWVDPVTWEQETNKLWPNRRTAPALTEPDQYVEIMQGLLRLQFDGLRNLIDKEKRNLSKAISLKPRSDSDHESINNAREKMEVRLHGLQDLVDRLKKAEEQLAADPDSTRREMLRVAEDYRALPKLDSEMRGYKSPPPELETETNLSVTEAPVKVPLATAPAFDDEFEQVPAAVRVRQIEQIRGKLEGVVLGVSLGVALLIAFAALYTNTWGTMNDLVAAALWGAGVNLATAGAFTGLPQLRSELISNPTGIESN